MTKGELLELLAPFTDDIRIVLTSLENTEGYYHIIKESGEGVIVIQGETEASAMFSFVRKHLGS